jgi:dihydroorotase-like cyclic amidohydrolase
LVRQGRLDAATALASVTWRAAQSLHLPGKGRIVPGYDGDLVLFDPEETRVVRAVELPSRSKWSAFEGRTLAGFPKFVVRRGELVFAEGRVQCTAGGRPLDLTPPRPFG